MVYLDFEANQNSSNITNCNYHFSTRSIDTMSPGNVSTKPKNISLPFPDYLK